jgi:hypothetical protein
MPVSSQRVCGRARQLLSFAACRLRLTERLPPQARPSALMSGPGRLPLVFTAALGLLTTSCGGQSPGQPTLAGVSLEDSPLLEQPNLSVTATGLVQEGQRLELGALVTNQSKTLDAREAVVALVAFDKHGEPIAQRPRELVSIPARATVAITKSLELKAGDRAVRAEAHIGLPDAAVTRAPEPMRLVPDDISIRDEEGALVVTGLVRPRLVYPMDYRVSVVLVAGGKFVASARTEFRPESGGATRFTARGQLPPGVDPSDLRPIITIIPSAREEE